MLYSQNVAVVRGGFKERGSVSSLRWGPFIGMRLPFGGSPQERFAALLPVFATGAFDLVACATFTCFGEALIYLMRALQKIF